MPDPLESVVIHVQSKPKSGFLAFLDSIFSFSSLYGMSSPLSLFTDGKVQSFSLRCDKMEPSLFNTNPGILF